MGYPAWDPSGSRGQKPPGTRRESRTGPVRYDIRDPSGNRLGVLAGYGFRLADFFWRLNPEKKLSQAGLAEFFLGG